MNIRNVPRHWKRNLLVALGLLTLFPLNLYAQNYDPYTTNTDVQPNPLLPVEFGGVGVFSFEAGNAGTSPLLFPQATEGNLMKLTISLGNGVPDVTDPNDPAQALAALSGALLSYFDFTYTPANNTYTGIQKATIPGNSSFAAAIPYRVTVNRFSGQADPLNGAAVDVSPPGYTNPQPESNDFASSYTYVEAFDDGDAPLTYGSALHELDVTQDTTPGQYDRFIYLGSVVDPEDGLQASEDTLGDDNNQTGGLGVNDEDGVAWPTSLDAGVTTNVPITTTLNGYTGQYAIQHWVDWGRDGSFSGDEGPVAFYNPFGGTHITSIAIAVPAGTPDGYYYARVRIHTGFSGPIAADQSTDNGEVEDYLIIVGNPTAVTIGNVNLEAASVTDFLNDLGANQMGTVALRDILKAWDPALAASAGGRRDAIVAALQKYLDPDDDGRVAVLHWDTLEERGTIGFYVKRSDANGQGTTIINNDMLPGLINAPMGGEYMLADPVPTSGSVYQYRFIEKEADGNTREYGPYYVEMPQ